MNRVYGYCRVSTPSQNIDRQVRNIKTLYPDAIIIQEAFTGRTLNRPEWSKLKKILRPGDACVFDSVSRMSRTADEGYEEYERLYNMGISLVFLKEAHINTDTYKSALSQTISLTGSSVDFILEGVNRYLLSLAKEQIRLAFEQSQKEVDDLRQRTREGIETARLEGKQIGGVQGRLLVTKKSVIAKEIIIRHSKDFGGTLTDTEVMTLAGVSHNSYYKYKRAIKNELEILVY